MTINREQIFGPVASVIRVKDYEEALAVANDTPYGLSSGIATTSLKHAEHFKRNSAAGGDGEPADRGRGLPRAVRRPQGLELRPAPEGGKGARALATTGATRDPHMADIPTIAESGSPGYDAINWYAYLAPAKTPKEIIERLNRELVKALGAPEVKELPAKQWVEPRPSTPEELQRTIEREHATWGRVVRRAASGGRRRGAAAAR